LINSVICEDKICSVRGDRQVYYRNINRLLEVVGLLTFSSRKRPWESIRERRKSKKKFEDVEI